MSINDANGNLHSNTDGRFTEKSGTRPTGSLTGRVTTESVTESVQSHSFNIYDHCGVGVDVASRFPATQSAAKAALRNTRGEPGGAVRAVFLDSRSAPGEVEVLGPKDGRPLLVIVNSGMCRLNITSGNVIIKSDSSWGNVVEVRDGAQATVITGVHRKCSNSVHGTGRLTVIPDEGARGLQIKNGPDSTLTVVDTGAANQIHVLISHGV